jgi:hypothetical protein
VIEFEHCECEQQCWELKVSNANDSEVTGGKGHPARQPQGLRRSDLILESMGDGFVMSVDLFGRCLRSGLTIFEKFYDSRFPQCAPTKVTAAELSSC